jgi:hypothetical protein
VLDAGLVKGLEEPILAFLNISLASRQSAEKLMDRLIVYYLFLFIDELRNGEQTRLPPARAQIAQTRKARAAGHPLLQHKYLSLH